MLGHRDSFNKYKRVEIIPTIFSDHNALNLEISCKKRAERTTNKWRLNNILLKNGWVREEIKRGIKRYIETNDNGNTTYQNFVDTAKAVIRGKFISLQAYLQKQEQAQINNLMLHHKKLEKEEQMKPKVGRRKEIIY